jgi:hypothetical protein
VSLSFTYCTIEDFIKKKEVKRMKKDNIPQASIFSKKKKSGYKTRLSLKNSPLMNELFKNQIIKNKEESTESMSMLIEKKPHFKKIIAHKKKKRKKKKINRVKLNQIRKTKATDVSVTNRKKRLLNKRLIKTTRVQSIQKKKNISVSKRIEVTENERKTGKQKEKGIQNIQIHPDCQSVEQSTKENESIFSLEQTKSFLEQIKSFNVSDPVQYQQHTEISSQIVEDVNTAESQLDVGKQEAEEIQNLHVGASDKSAKETDKKNKSISSLQQITGTKSVRTFIKKSPIVKTSGENGNSLVEESGIWSANL